jgi:hypothetical protein
MGVTAEIMLHGQSFLSWQTLLAGFGCHVGETNGMEVPCWELEAPLQ